MNRKEAQKELAPILNRMPAYTKLIYLLYSNPELKGKDKALLTAGLIYAISPIDLVPGFIPVVGQLDDVIIALGVLKRLLRKCPLETLNQYEERTGITLPVVERDLAAAKKVALGLVASAAVYLAKGVHYGGKKIFVGLKKILLKKHNSDAQ